MTMYAAGFKQSTGEVIVVAEVGDIPSGYVSMGTFSHDCNQCGDKLGAQHSHVFYHHIQDLLYRNYGIQAMQSTKIIDATQGEPPSAEDTVPDAFTIPEVLRSVLGQTYESSAVTPVGYITPTTISVASPGQISVNNGTWGSGATINPTQSFKVRLAASGIALTKRTVTVTMSGVTADFDVTTGQPMAAPVWFLDAVNVTASMTAPSNAGENYILGTLNNPIEGETLAISPNDGRVKLVNGVLMLGASVSSEGTVEYTLSRTHPNSIGTTTFPVIVATTAALPTISTLVVTGHPNGYDAGARGRELLAGAQTGSHIGYIQSVEGATLTIIAQSTPNLVSITGGNHLVAGTAAATAVAGTPTVTVLASKAGHQSRTQVIPLKVNSALSYPRTSAAHLVAVGDSLVANTVTLTSVTYPYRMTLEKTRWSTATSLSKKFKMVAYRQPANTETDANGVKNYWGDFQGYSGGNASASYARGLLEGALAQQPDILYYCFGTNSTSSGFNAATAFSYIVADIEYAHAARPSMRILVGNLSAIGKNRVETFDRDVFLALNAMITGGTYDGVSYPGIADGRSYVTLVNNFAATANNPATLTGGSSKVWPAYTTGVLDNFAINNQRGNQLNSSGDGVHDGIQGASILGKVLADAVNPFVNDGVDGFAENPNPNLLSDALAWAVGTTTTAIATTGSTGTVVATSSLKGVGITSNADITTAFSVEANVDAGAPANSRKTVIAVTPVAGSTSRNKAANFSSVSFVQAGLSGQFIQGAVYLEVSDHIGWEMFTAYLQLSGLTSDVYPTDSHATKIVPIAGIPNSGGTRLIRVTTPVFKVPPAPYKGWAGANFQMVTSLNVNPAVMLAAGNSGITAKIVKADVRIVADPTVNPAG